MGREPSPTATPAYVGIVAFGSGLCLMILEITASRVLAPVFGNTIYLWSSIIGLVLAALSLGYWLGGRLGERRPGVPILFGCALGAGAFIALIPTLSSWMLEPLADSTSPETGAVAASAVLFFAPSVLIGAMSPLAVKVYSAAGHDAGRASGLVSSLGAIGSILGTFATGFFLVPHFGTRAILYALATAIGGLGVLGAVLFRQPRATGVGVVLVLLSSIAATSPRDDRAGDEVYREESQYHRIGVSDVTQGDRKVRILTLDTTAEGAMYLDGPGLHFWYTQYVDVIDAFSPDAESAAFVGGGAFTMPKRFLEKHPGSRADVFEIDPALVEVGRNFFGLEERAGLRVVTGDARWNLRLSDTRYDFVFGDAYNGIRSVPFHLTTREYMEVVRARLTQDGVYAINIISSLSGKRSSFFRATLRTLSEVFPEVHVFAHLADRTQEQNLILVALNQARGLSHTSIRQLGLEIGLEHLTRHVVDPKEYREAAMTAEILTDDHAPVAYLVRLASDD